MTTQKSLYGGESFLLQTGTRALRQPGGQPGTVSFPKSFPTKPVISLSLLAGSASIGRAQGLRVRYTGAGSFTFFTSGSGGTIAWSAVAKYTNWPSSA